MMKPAASALIVRAHRLAALSLALAAMVLAACTPGQQATSTPAPLPTETLRLPPTATPGEPATPTHTPSPAPSPTATRPPQPATATPAPPTATRLPATATPLPPTPTPRPPTATPAPPTPTPPPPTATAVVVPLDPVCYASSGRLNLYAGPATSYAVVVVLGINEEVRPIARTADARWLQVVTLDGLQGWLAADLGRCQFLDLGRLLVVRVPDPPAPPPPTATPTTPPLVIREWRGEYFNNADLSGSPVLVRNDGNIAFTWGDAAAAAGLLADRFSVRWTRTLEFGAGSYRFNLSADDGARLFIDDVLVLDMWELGSLRTRSVVLSLPAGARRVRVEYFENTGSAACSFSWETAQFSGWRGEYYANANLSGSPALVRDDPSVGFTWGSGPAAPGLPADNFSVRWTRDVVFEGGVYRVTVRVDDGVRIWIEGNLVLDEWRPGSAVHTRDVTVNAGQRNVRVEYFEQSGDAHITWTWDRQPESFPNYRGEYFNNDSLAGGPVLVRNDAVLDFIWGEGRPDARFTGAAFSARWTGRPAISAGVYKLRAESDDGVRVWIDGVLMIDAWRPGAVSAEVDLTIPASGPHDVRVEYFQRGGVARLHVWWISVRGLIAQ